MKKLLLATAALAALSTASLAADLPSRKGPPPMAPVVYVPAFTWTGFYIGIQGGYAWGRSNGVVNDGVAEGYGYDPKGGLFGVHAGYNYQFSPWLVAGLEADVEWSGLRGSGLTSLATYSHRTDIDWQGSVRGRLGVAFERALIYATGGVAFADIDRTVSIPGVTQLSHSTNRAGWTIGGGIEYALTNNITMRGEYRYTDYGRQGATNAAIPISDSSKLTTHTVRAGLSYKF